jgi:uncharacterized repeat protein (TIGR01451 family)
MISVDDTPDFVNAGENVAYEITVQNAGPDAAADVEVLNTLPLDSQYVSDSLGGGDEGVVTAGTGPNNEDQVTFDLGTLANGDTVTFDLVTRVDPWAVVNDDGFKVITNEAEVTSSEPEVDDSDNTATETTNVGELAQLSLHVFPDQTEFGTADENTIYFHVKNAGPSVARNPVMTVFVDLNSAVSFDANGCSIAIQGAGSGAMDEFACDFATKGPGGDHHIGTFGANYVPTDELAFPGDFTDIITPGEIYAMMNFQVPEFYYTSVDFVADLKFFATVTTETPLMEGSTLSDQTTMTVLPDLSNVYIEDIDEGVSSPTGNLVIHDVVSYPGETAEGRNDSLTISRDGNEIVITDANNELSLAGNVVAVGGTGQGSQEIRVPASLVTGKIIVDTGIGDDMLSIDNSGGLLPDVEFAGGSGVDTLMTTGAIDSTTHNIGPGPGEGSIVQVDGAESQTMTYTGLEPIIDLAPAATLFVSGTNADNAINYTQGSVPANGLVSVDGFETIEFSNKASLVINGLAGSDTINLNNPSTPAGLTVINVSAGDPTAGSDSVVVNNTLVGTDVDVDTLTGDGAVVTGAQPVPVSIDGAELLTVNMLNTADDLLIETPTGQDNIHLTPGPDASRGQIHMAGSSLLPIAYAQFDGGEIEFADAGGGRADTLTVAGDPGPSLAQVESSGRVKLDAGLLGGGRAPDVRTPGIQSLTLIGDDGDDLFIVDDHPFSSLVIDGGDPGTGSDTLILTADDTVSFAASVGFFGPAGGGFFPNGTINAFNLLFHGLELLQLNGDGNDVNFSGVANADETIEWRPTSSDAGDLTTSGLPTLFRLQDIGDLDIRGNGGSDLLRVHGNASANTIDVGPSSITYAGSLQGINDYTQFEAIEVNGGAGDDTVNVTPGPIPIRVNGGDPSGQLQQPVGDLLDVLSGGGGFAYYPGATPDSGTVDVAGSELVSFTEIEQLQVDNTSAIVLPDAFEGDLVSGDNNSIAAATVLGSEHKITLRDLTLHSNLGTDPADGTLTTDEDYFQITAQDTGKLVINAFFTHAESDVDIYVVDADGDPVASATSPTDNEQIVIPVVGQQRYYLLVNSATQDPATYDLEIENFDAPIPHIPELPALDQFGALNDTGMSQTDDITARTEPEIIIEADLDEFANEGINILDNTEIAAGDPGAAVEVYVNGNPVGFADPIPNTGNTKFRYTFTAGQLPETVFFHSSGGWLHNVKAAVRMFDGQTPGVSARSPLSEPLELVVDDVAPAGTVPDMLAASDTGFESNDNVTYLANPAFQGTAEPNSKVFLFAESIDDGVTEMVGEGTVRTDGTWEVTIEPLDHSFPIAEYIIYAQYEDLAGNVSDAPGVADGLTMWHDSTPPNIPYLDLISEDDKGWSDTDNLTQDLDLHFDVTVNDTSDDGNPFPNDVSWSIRDRQEDGGGEVEVANSGGFSTDGFWDDVNITFSDYGVHDLKLVATDRAGHTSEFLLPIHLDPDACDVSVARLADGQVILYDADAAIDEDVDNFEINTDVDASDVRVYVDANHDVFRVDIVGNPTGLGMIINPADGGTVEVHDQRLGLTPPERIEHLSFIVSTGYLKKLDLHRGIEGRDISDILKCEGFTDFDLDNDGNEEDRTAVYATNSGGWWTINGHVSGDLVVEEAFLKDLVINNGDVGGKYPDSGDVYLPEGRLETFLVLRDPIHGPDRIPDDIGDVWGDIYAYDGVGTFFANGTYFGTTTTGTDPGSGIALQTVPYMQDFSSGLPERGDGWVSPSTPWGRQQVVGGALQMDSFSNGGFGRNEAVVHLDSSAENAADADDLILTFSERDWSDEHHPMPSQFTGHSNSDGVAISTDGGATWHRVWSEPGTGAFQEHTVNLDAALRCAGINYGPELWVRFQQYDNYPVALDGRGFDDITFMHPPAPTPQTLDHAEDFSGGQPDAADGWAYYTAGPGRTQVVSGQLRMDSCTSGGFALNEAILYVDTTGETTADAKTVTLTFDERGWSDEHDPMSAQFTGHENADGVAISTDGGTTWYRAWSAPSTSTFQTHTVDLDALLTSMSDNYGAVLQIKFQQYDNYPMPLDGLAYDNIDVVDPPAPAPPAPQAIAYAQDFSGGQPAAADGWTYASTGTGRIQVASGQLRMDSATEGSPALNEAILHLDTAGQSTADAGELTLTFSERGWSDEHHAMSTQFTGQENTDGVAISTDGGTTWHRLWSAAATDTVQAHAVNLDAALVSLGLTYGDVVGDTLQVKFQQYDNYPIGKDGRAYDDITVQEVLPPPPPTPQAIAYSQDFSAGQPGSADGWEYYTTATGQVDVSGGALRLSDTVDGGAYALAEAILHLDLDGQSGVQLSFDHINAADEAHALPTTFTGHANGDGVAFSADGTTWHRLTALDGSFTGQVFDLDAAIAAAGISYTNDFQIKFQQYDNYSWGLDGRAFDNILVTV